MNNAQQMYALNLEQITTAIRNGGNKRTILVQGHMGTGKSSLLKTLAAELPNHTPCYFDCTTKDLGDISIPKLATLSDDVGSDYVSYATNPHARNRMTVITARKPDHMEWIEWGINNGVDHTLLGWCKDNPHLFYGFEDVKNPDDNPYIYHPKQQRAAFVTPRSLEAASDWLKVRDSFDDQTLVGLLMGTIGDRGAMDLMAFVKLADQLPSMESIKQDPKNAKVPDSASAICMVVYRTLASLDKDWVDAWMDYMVRLDKEAQGMFANGVRAPKYAKQAMVMTNKKFTQWAMNNNYMFAADKK
jgi:hypothetical protein